MRKALLALALVMGMSTAASAGGRVGVYVDVPGFAFGYNRGFDGGWYPNYYGPTIYDPYFRPAPFAYGYVRPRYYAPRYDRRYYRRNYYRHH